MISGPKSRVFFTALCLWPAGLLEANVIVNTSISLIQLTITPQSGSIMFVAPENSPPDCTSAHFCATAFTQAQDSLGGFSQQYKVADNGATTSSASTALASAMGKASVPALTAMATSAVKIISVDASASSSAMGNPASLVGTFEVSIATALNISATIASNQSLSTDIFGVSAFSEAIFSVQLDNGDIPVFFDNPLSIGPNTSLVDIRDPHTLPGSTSMLQANTPYSIFIQTDAESQGVNSVPEPSSVSLTVLALAGLIAVHSARRKKSA
jgi:hypothetical protein